MALPGNKDFNDYDNYVTDPNPTTSAQAQDYFRNQAELLKAVIDCDFWQPETTYQPGDVVKSDSMPNGTEAVMVATKASVTSNVEPQWGAVGGANISDGACFWKLRWQHWSKVVIPMSNLGIAYATQAEAEAGSDNEKLMTPLLTKNAIDKFALVKSVNGKTGDVVVGDVTNLSISGKTITVTFADGTTKTLTTQDTSQALVPNWNAEIAISNTKGGFAYTTPSNGFLMIRRTSGDGSGSAKLYYGNSDSGKVIGGLNDSIQTKQNQYNGGNMIILVPVAKSETYYFVTTNVSYFAMAFIPAKAVAI